MAPISRRKMLGTLGALPLAGTAAGAASAARGRDEVAEADGAALVTDRDRKEYARLKALNLDAPEAKAKQKEMPAGKIGDLRLGRIVCGSNLISMNMHARDLDYVTALASRYNTEARVLMTLKKCEELGINSIVLKDHNFRRFPGLKRYWDAWGGRMKWIADVITTDIDKFDERLQRHLDLGAAAAYVWGGASDIWYANKKPGNILKAFQMIRDAGVPAGVAAHRLEPIRFCVEEGLKPDFYMLTLHHDRYWSAHPKENRRFMEMYEKESPHHDRYHDNMFCHNHEETVEFMQEVDVPWMAYKVLAAGAIPPKDGITYAFESGADFICLGFFDFQLDEDARIARKAIAGARNRKRPWSA